MTRHRLSASHNPFYDNGSKHILPTGRKIDEDLETCGEWDIETGTLPGDRDKGETSIDTSGESEFRRAYLEHLIETGDGFNWTGAGSQSIARMEPRQTLPRTF